ncbi:MAG: O-antigen ligase family protein [Deltaproteobacteria bacterium]|nr:O-antigen ligase family protein [Deltaproteobacteria bacterium]
MELLTNSRFSKYSHFALAGYCLASGLSIGLSQTIIVVTLLYWIAYLVKQISLGNRFNDQSSELQAIYAHQLTAPIMYWVTISFVSALVGMNSGRALEEAFKMSIYLLLPFCVFTSLSSFRLNAEVRLGRMKCYLFCLLLSQIIAGVYRTINVGFNDVLVHSLKPPGAVTESGQLVLVIAGVIGLWFISALGRTSAAKPSALSHKKASEAAMAVSVFLGVLIIAWPDVFGLNRVLWFSPVVRIFLALGIMGMLLPMFVFNFSRHCVGKELTMGRLNGVHVRRFLLFGIATLFAVFLINLKRGPWLGVCLELLIVGVLLSRRLIFFTVFFIMATLVALAPARTRLMQLVDDFVISGGRQYMWEIGSELAQRFPVGLGLDNAQVMRNLDPSLPELHRHMHNNLLNVAVENGWLGMMVYIWWMFVAIKMGFVIWQTNKGAVDLNVREGALLGLFLSCGLVGWQVAGLAEYNFGDGEVCMIALFFMGLLLTLGQLLQKPVGAR